MKKLIFTLMLMSVVTLAFTQTTYYFVGGNVQTSFTGNSNWSRVQNSSDPGDLRTAAAATDILVIDGSNIGGSVALQDSVRLTVSSNTIGQLRIINNAAVLFQRPTGGGGTGTLTIQGDTGDDFILEAGSSLTLNSPSTDGSVVISLGASTPGVTGRVGGTLTFKNTGSHRMAPFTPSGLIFESTAVVYDATVPTSSAYIFGSSAAAQGAIPSAVFLSGASLIHTGKYSPMGSSSSAQVIDFQPGSNYYFRTTNAASTGSYVAQKLLANFYVQNNSTFTADGSVYKFEKLAVEAGSTYITHNSGSTPVTDDIQIDGTLTAPAGPGTNILVLAGAKPLNLPGTSGTGTINIPQIIAGEYAKITLKKNINVYTSVILMDTFDFGNFQLAPIGSGTPTLTVRGLITPITNYTAAATAGSYQLTSVTPTPSSLIGLTVSGPGVQPNTVVVAFLSAGTVNLSKPLISSSAAGTSFTFQNNSPSTLITSNANGFDSTAGSVILTGQQSYNSTIGYVFNGATTKPFNLSPYNSTSAGSVTFNAPVTLNRNVTVNGALTINSKVTVPANDTITVSSTGSITGGSASNYIVTDKGASSAGVLYKKGFTAAQQFPVGSPARYMPVTLTPQAAPADFLVSVFEGVTNEGTVNGTAFTPTQKSDVVDAVWTINRPVGSVSTDACTVTINWDAALEGSNFAAFSNAETGITHHNGVIWEPATGSGNNATNTATATFTTFSPFSIAKILGVVPVQFISVNAAYTDKKVNVSWQIATDESIDHYTVERAGSNMVFAAAGNIASRNATGSAAYIFADLQFAQGVNYYRIKAVSNTGEIKYSAVARINTGGKADFTVLQNPVKNKALQVSMSSLSAGKYSLSLVNAAGQRVYAQDITYAGGAASNTINLPASVTTGIYRVVLRSSTEVKSITVIVE